MTISKTAVAAGALLLLCAADAAAQALSADDFSKRPEAWEVSLSPSGQYVAMAVPTADGSETRLEVLDITTGKSKILRFGPQMHVSDILWTGDEQIVVSRAQSKPMRARPVTQGELYTTDANGKRQDVLFGYVPERGGKRGKRNDHGFSWVVAVPSGEPGMAMVQFSCWDCGHTPDTVIFKVNTETGERSEVERDPQGTTYGFDQAGEARLRTMWDDSDEPVLSYRRHKGDEWAPLPKSIAGRLIYNVRFAQDNNTAYAFVTDAKEPAQAYRIDLEAGTRTRLAGNPDVAVDRFMYEGLGGTPFAVTYEGSKPMLEYIDPDSEWAKLHAALMRAVPGQIVYFTSFSRDGGKVLFSAVSDRNVGSYYLYDRTAQKLQKVMDYKPWFKPEDMAPSMPFEFTNRDGVKLFGFYTAKGTGPKPMVVMAHGGPFGVSDSWGFDNEIQFLASRGYGVLQVNYRGSGNRGEGFEESGWRGWGTSIQHDVADAVHWAISRNLADPARICTYGASFGGYTALEQPIQEPGLYKCAIGYAGVYDLPLMRKTDKGFYESDRTKRFWERTLGTDMDQLARISPARHAADIKIPVMLVHGTSDKTADFNQYKAMVSALEDAGSPPETYVVRGEGHGFVKPEHEAELYRRIVAFLDKHIGEGAK